MNQDMQLQTQAESTINVPVVCKINNQNNYDIQVGNGKKLELVRDVDFGKIPGTKSPSLFKSGAERILFALGVESEYTVEQAIEEYTDNPFFFYRVKCSLYKQTPDGRIHITDGMGSANTNERQCGSGNKFDMANSRLKMAKKRAMVDATLMIGQLSNAFTQDVEDDNFMGGAQTIISDDAPITTKQITRLFAAGTRAGKTKEEVKKDVNSLGFKSTKEITQKDYENVFQKVSGNNVD